MTLARRGQSRPHRGLGLVSALAVQFHWQNLFECAFRISADVESAGSAKHRQTSAITNKILNPLQIYGIEISAMRKIIQDDDVKVLELLQKNIVDGKWNQAELIFRYVNGVR